MAMIYPLYFQFQSNSITGLLFGGQATLIDGELEDKFREMAVKYMGEEQIRKIFDTVWNVERLDDISKLTRLMVFQPR